MSPFPFVICSGRLLLPVPLVSTRGIVRVKEHNRFLSCLAFGKRKFPLGALRSSLFIRCYDLFSAKNGCGTYCVLCITPISSIYSIPLFRIVDTSEIEGQRTRANGVTVLLCGLKHFTSSGSWRYQKSLPVCRPGMFLLLM